MLAVVRAAAVEELPVPVETVLEAPEGLLDPVAEELPVPAPLAEDAPGLGVAPALGLVELPQACAVEPPDVATGVDLSAAPPEVTLSGALELVEAWGAGVASAEGFGEWVS